MLEDVSRHYAFSVAPRISLKMRVQAPPHHRGAFPFLSSLRSGAAHPSAPSARFLPAGISTALRGASAHYPARQKRPREALTPWKLATGERSLIPAPNSWSPRKEMQDLQIAFPGLRPFGKLSWQIFTGACLNETNSVERAGQVSRTTGTGVVCKALCDPAGALLEASCKSC